jgi:hypothetical protein
MSFLAPLFLGGLLAIAAPIIFHLIRRTSRERIPFSSLMFLQPTPPRVTRSSRLEHILLLILRCVALCLLALGFARPFLQRPVAADTGSKENRRLAIVIDASASMRRDGLWSEAKSKAERAIRRARPTDTLAVFLLDRTARPLLTFDQWTATPMGDRLNVALDRVASAEAGWGGTHLGHGMLAVVEALEDNASRGSPMAAVGPRQLVLISDLQEGAHLDGLQGFDWPRGLEVVLDPVKSKRPTNAGLQLLLEHDETQQPAADAEVHVRVLNVADSKREQFQLGWAKPGEKAFAAPPIDVYVPPGQSRVVSAPKLPAGTAPELLKLTGDDEDFDNQVFLVNPKPEQVKVLYLGVVDEKVPEQSLAYYLRRAFQETRRQAVQLLVRPSGGPVPAEELFSAAFLVVGEAPTGEGAKAVRAFLDAGKPVLFVMKTIAAAPTLAEIAGLGTVSAEESPANNYALLGQVDFEHPLFAPFADPRFSDFTKIHFWKHRRLDPAQFKEAKVVARFDKGDPALLQVAIGKGLLFILTSGWQAADSQLALSSKFVPLLYSMLELSGGVKAQLAQFQVGDSIPLPSTNAAQAFVVRKPDGTQKEVPAGSRFEDANQPGIYIATAGTTVQRFAVNLDPSESRTGVLLLEDLERLRLPISAPTPESVKQAEKKRLRLQAAELEQRQKLWRWLMVAALVILVVETWLAGWMTRRNREADAAPQPA